MTDELVKMPEIFSLGACVYLSRGMSPRLWRHPLGYKAGFNITSLICPWREAFAFHMLNPGPLPFCSP